MWVYLTGSVEERKAVHKAFRKSTRLKDLDFDSKQEVSFKLNVPHSLMVGRDLKVTVDLDNQSSESKAVKICLTFVMTYYTGVASERFLTDKYDRKLSPKGGETSRCCNLWTFRTYCDE